MPSSGVGAVIGRIDEISTAIASAGEVSLVSADLNAEVGKLSAAVEDFLATVRA